MSYEDRHSVMLTREQVEYLAALCRADIKAKEAQVDEKTLTPAQIMPARTLVYDLEMTLLWWNAGR